MLANLINTMVTSVSNDKEATRRRHPRRNVDRCVAVVCGQTFPVEDWSLGGVQLRGDERLFGQSQDLDVTMKFRLRSTIIDVDVKGKVVRRTRGSVAIQFEPLAHMIRRAFHQVIDDAVAAEFANSQT